MAAGGSTPRAVRATRRRYRPWFCEERLFPSFEFERLERDPGGSIHRSFCETRWSQLQNGRTG
eukprot:3209629-Amphidinium_carterae.1